MRDWRNHPLLEAWRSPRGVRRALVVLAIGVLLIGGRQVIYATGGTKYAYDHVMYVPVMLAAFTLGIRGGVVAGLLASILVGPWMPLDVASGQSQAPSDWLLRAGFYLAFGIVAGARQHLITSQLAALKKTNIVLAQRERDLQEAYGRLQKAQEQLASQERLQALGQMASGVVHDFNNALTGVIGYAELLRTRPELTNDPDQVRGLTGDILTAASDAAAIVARLRDFYRPRGVDEPFTRVDLRALVESTVRMASPRWQNAGTHVAVRSELAPVPPIACVESELRQALVNVIFNAADAMPTGGTLLLRTLAAPAAADGGRPRVSYGEAPAIAAVIEVGDTGVGMDEPTLKHCVDPFFTTKGTRGTGLGLPSVYGMVRRHSGRLEIESAPGRGTTVRLCLPAQPAATEQGAPLIQAGA
ncbi:MAG: hypothetical protein HYY04_15275 [Chloroflexi bacterium]|nr:hypothetical protein [Chloroflexota bacterium]